MDKDPNPERKTVSSSYPSHSHCDDNESPIKKRSLENQIDLPNTNKTEKISNQTAKSNTNNNGVTASSEEWKKGTTLIMGDFTVSSLMEKRMSRNRTMKVRFFPRH